MNEQIKVFGDMSLNGALVMSNSSTEFPVNPVLGTFLIKDFCLYGYIRIGGMETWYPFASKTNSFIHTQGIAALSWIVNHGLNTSNVWIQVKDELGNIVSVGKQSLDDNSFRLSFTTAVRGTVIVVAPDSIDVPIIKGSLLNIANDAVQIDSTGVKIHGEYALTAANIDQQIADAVAPKADTTYVDSQLQAIIGAAPAALDTLKEIADQLASDESAASALTNTVAAKADKTYVDTKLALKTNDADLSPVAKTGAYVNLTGCPVLGTAAAKDAPALGDAASFEVVLGGDSRLSDSRNPKSHGHDISNVAGLQVSLDSKATPADISAALGTLSVSGNTNQDFTTKDLTVNGDIMPTVSGISQIGSVTKKFGAIYTKELHIDANTLYVDGVPVIGSSANSIDITADVNQGMRIATTGSGTLVLDSNAGTTIGTSGQNADVLIQSSGQGSLTRVSSSTRNVLTAPVTDIQGNLSASGNLTVVGDLTVAGTTTSVNSTNATVKDNVFTVNKGETGSGVSLRYAGLDVDRGDLGRQRIVWDETAGGWVAGMVGQELSLATESFVSSAVAPKADSATVTAITTAVSLKAPLESPAFTGTVSGITAGMVGLGSVNNTADSAKPVSTAQAVADTVVQSAAATDATTKANAAQAAAIAASTPVAHVGSSGASHGVVTTTVAGFMTAADKVKIDAIAGTNTGDQVIPIAASTTPSELGVANVGNATTFARANHVHLIPTLATLGAQDTASKDATGGYAGLTLFKLNFKNAANTFTSFFTNANTAARTYTFPNKDITVAGLADVIAQPITGYVSGAATVAETDTLLQAINKLNGNLAAALTRIGTLETNLANAVFKIQRE